MHRRLALAFSLAFTTIVTFGIIAVGRRSASQLGTPGGGRGSRRASSYRRAAGAADRSAAAADPIVVTQYDYVDVPDPAPTKATVPTTAPSRRRR